MENINGGFGSNKVGTNNAELQNILEQSSKFNERYGMDIENLLDILQRQMDQLYLLSDQIKNDKLQEETVFAIGQSETLIKVIKEKAGWQTFHKIGNYFHNLKKVI